MSRPAENRRWHDQCFKPCFATSGFDPAAQNSTMKHRKKTDPIEFLIEAMLDFALVAGFLSAIGFLVSVTGRLVF
jgi:hypothetical protein